jgi:glyoxylase-like metal-dependent hydrolase (beta-lactamase superfamily II)
MGGAFVQADIQAARDFNYLELDGEYDLFGDGTVRIIPTPGHTIGHQSMKVKLPKAGTMIISQDAVLDARELRRLRRWFELQRNRLHGLSEQTENDA